MKKKQRFESEDENYSRTTTFMGRDKSKQETLFQFLKRRTQNTIQRSLKSKKETTEPFTYTHNKSFTQTAKIHDSSLNRSFDFRNTNKSFTNLDDTRTLSPEKATPYKQLIHHGSAELDTEVDKADLTQKKKGVLDESFEKTLSSAKRSTRRPNLSQNALKNEGKEISSFCGFSPQKLSRALRSNENSLITIISEFDNTIQENLQKSQDLLKVVERAITTCQKAMETNDPEFMRILEDIKSRKALLKKTMEGQSNKSQQGWDLIKETFENFENELNYAIEECSRRAKKLIDNQRDDFNRMISKLKNDATNEKFYNSTLDDEFNNSKSSIKVGDIYNVSRNWNNTEISLQKRRASALEQQIENLREVVSRKDREIVRLENQIEAFQNEYSNNIPEKYIRSHPLYTQLEDQVVFLQEENKKLRDLADRATARARNDQSQNDAHNNRIVEYLERMLEEKQKNVLILSEEVDVLKGELQMQAEHFKSQILELQKENAELFNKVTDHTFKTSDSDREAFYLKYDQLARRYEVTKEEASVLWGLLRELKMFFNSEKFTNCIKSLFKKYDLDSHPEAKFFNRIV